MEMIWERPVNVFRILFSGLLLISSVESQAQNQFNYFYRVYFNSKGDYNPAGFKPEELLGPGALNRRQKYGIPVPDYRDLPVYPQYIESVISLGFTLHCTSHWLNTALFKTQNSADITPIQNLPFVKEVRIVKHPVAKGVREDKLRIIFEEMQNPPWDNPVTMMNGGILHNSGFDGNGVLIAVLDGGFAQADIISSLYDLRYRNGIKATKDFVGGSNNVYGYHNHGTAVLSVLAGMSPGEIQGSAPGADFILLRTEDTSSEFPVEEDFWAAGAEYADSAGADIISSSLGYSRFDDPAMDYKFSDLNGHTAFVTMAAEAAASKGMLVVTSAGNERNTSWQRIIAPTDGDSVLSAGAVDGYGVISSFSSAGPSADGRVKPDNVAQGVSVPVQVSETGFARANGTSFSCPLLSGICACFMNAVPQALNMEIINSLHEYGDRASRPDSLYGYGLPDAVKIVENLENKFTVIPTANFSVGPNPFTDYLKVIFRDVPGSLDLEIFNTSGILIARRSYPDYISRILEINDLADKGEGLYIVRIRTSGKPVIFKVTKLDR